MENETEKIEEVNNIITPPTAPTTLTTPVAIIIAGLLIGGGLFFGLKSNKPVIVDNANLKKQQVANEKPPVQQADIKNVKIEGEPFIGNPNAPVTMAYWFDYQCPYCKRFDKGTISSVVDNYVKNGKVKIVFKDYQFLGPDSNTAGLAARAVFEIAPDKYYEWHTAMFEKQDNENSGWGNKKDILALTKSLGIDSVKVAELMVSKASQYQQSMDADKQEGTKLGINGTPGTIIGKQLLAGAETYSTVQQLIDSELSSK